jgi:5-methylcytosine-specific restriction endonuclease McrA
MRRNPAYAADYDRLRTEVLDRDEWRCQRCGGKRNLDVHHVRPRSQGGFDVADNLIVLCRSCHTDAHRNKGRHQ